MLKIAYPYKEKLQHEYEKTLFNDFYKFYNNGSYWDYEFKVENRSWECIEYVSVDDNDNILGYLKATIARPENYVDSVAVMNFSNKCNYSFSKDMSTFLRELFTKHNFYKINFFVIIGNPIERMYDKLIKKYGGRIVGIQMKHAMLSDGLLYDRKLYEIFKDDYLSSLRK